MSGSHLADRFLEGRRAAVVEVGRRCRHVAQARHTQDLGVRRGERVKDAVPLEQVAAYIHTLMTGDAADRLE